MYKILLLMVSFFLVSVVSPLQAMISEDQAKDSVRSFESNQNIQFDKIELVAPEDVPSWVHSDYELFNGDDSWNVDSENGQVKYASHFDMVPDSNLFSDTPFGNYSEQQCQQIARDFASAKYENFDSRNMVPSDGEWDQGLYWTFLWDEKLEHNAEYFNHVEVSVSPLTGNIISYDCENIPLPVMSPLLIDENHAISIAMQAADIDDDSLIIDHYLSADVDGSYTWEFRISIESPFENPAFRLIRINGATGKVIANGNVYSDRDSAESDSYFKIRCLSNVYKDASITWKNAKLGAKLKLRGVTFWVKPGARSVTLLGTKIKLTKVAKIKNGRLLVPGTFLREARSLIDKANSKTKVKSKINAPVKLKKVLIHSSKKR